MPIVIPAVLVLVIALATLLYAFVMFDRLVRAEYEHDRAAWEADGRPRGFFWRAPECTWFRSAWSINRLSLRWLFTTPAWVAQSPACRDWLRRLRACILVWNIFIFGLLIVIAFTLYDHAA
jgi:hypothetical protein